jgi:regulator of cell morphogenesis and NO signaling
MSEIATLQDQIGNAAAQHRGLRALFEELGLDYYCEGDLTIDEAACAAGLDVAVVQGRIENLAGADAGPSWPDRSLAELIAYLETEHHGLARNLVFETGALFGEVCRAGNDSRLSSMRSAFRRLSEQLILHIEHEELTIFPAVLALEEAWTRSERPPPKLEGGIRTALSRIVLEHFEISQRLREMHRNRVELPGTIRRSVRTAVRAIG